MEQITEPLIIIPKGIYNPTEINKQLQNYVITITLDDYYTCKCKKNECILCDKSIECECTNYTCEYCIKNKNEYHKPYYLKCEECENKYCIEHHTILENYISRNAYYYEDDDEERPPDKLLCPECFEYYEYNYGGSG
jgi:hypothetical protein